jgi:hypothetical protein
MFIWDWFTGVLGYLGECQTSVNVSRCLLTNKILFVFRIVEEIRQVAVPGTRQCRQNDAAAHAQGRQTSTARTHTPSDIRGALHRQYALYHIRLGWTLTGASRVERLLPRRRCHRFPHRRLGSKPLPREQNRVGLVADRRGAFQLPRADIGQ